LGRRLFERHNRRVALTPAAKAYLAEIGPLFEQLSQATARYGVPGDGFARTLAVSAPATFTLRWLVPRLAKFRAERIPRWTSTVETSNEPVESLQAPYDVIIRGGPDTFYGYAMRPFLVRGTAAGLQSGAPAASAAADAGRLAAAYAAAHVESCRDCGRTGWRGRRCPRCGRLPP
jgi:DNA-binding transcriptional LysR family regulator